MDYTRSTVRLSPECSNNTQQSQTSAAAFGRSSQTSSATTTSYPSPTSDSGNSHNTSQLTHQLHPIRCATQLNLQPSVSQSHPDAPLPSPSAGGIDPFFGRPHPQPNPYQSFYPEHQQQQQQQQQQQHHAPSQPPRDQSRSGPHHNSFSHNNNNCGQPGALPADFLVEAAKRAQMACLMRDMGEVSL